MIIVNVKDLSPTNRHLRLRRLEILKSIVQAHSYDVGSDKIAEGIISEAEDSSRADRHREPH
jgi:anti-sigma28 factor (negative regulator of flagellin synthesis)